MVLSLQLLIEDRVCKIKKKKITMCYFQEINFKYKNINSLKVKEKIRSRFIGWKKGEIKNWNKVLPWESWVVMLYIKVERLDK